MDSGGGLPDLSNLKDQVGSIFPAQAPAQEGIREPNPENMFVALAMLVGENKFRISQEWLTQIQLGLERGEFIMNWSPVSALQANSGTPEWEVLIAPRAALEGNPTPHQNQSNVPPGYPGETQTPEGLDVRAQGTGQKVEYSWAELQEWDDSALAEVGLIREQVDINAAKAHPVPHEDVEKGRSSAGGHVGDMSWEGGAPGYTDPSMEMRNLGVVANEAAPQEDAPRPSEVERPGLPSQGVGDYLPKE